ncbi:MULTISPECIES: YdhK family protein [unclassified Bacillus (in: firmicutes)]|uniref:YdhK family protein n=1 Tax=unclassified Bacillus (in: firmicutes) TaxID=185979 RepID=UPI0027DFF405|nr:MULTISPECIES: YdhK family protein [unclassified Bacillus (in: firmicutes)]
MKKRTILFLLTVITALFLAACSNGDEANEHSNMNHGEKTEQEKNSSSKDHEGMDDMNHSSSGEVPEGLKEAENPTFKVGSTAIINSNHMEGMKGAEATIVGAYDTTVYTISYTPTTGGEKVTNHKWIIHEEIKDASDKPYKPGDEVIVEADHMTGMKGATAVIDSAQQTTVYMVDFTPTTGGEKVTNHKWVTESELSSK